MRNESTLKRNLTRKSLSSAYKFLFEQEDKEEAGGDLFGDEGGEDKKEDKEEGGDDAGGEEAGGEDKDKEEDKDKGDDKKEDEAKPKLSPEDEARLEDSVDSELESVMLDMWTDAEKSYQANQPPLKKESLSRAFFGKLNEAAEEVDIKHFAGDVARLVKNYQNLLDMESIILNKAYSFIQNKYDKADADELVSALKDVLEQEYGIDVDRHEIEEDEPEIPIAVGARAAAGG